MSGKNIIDFIDQEKAPRKILVKDMKKYMEENDIFFDKKDKKQDLWDKIRKDYFHGKDEEEDGEEEGEEEEREGEGEGEWNIDIGEKEINIMESTFGDIKDMKLKKCGNWYPKIIRESNKIGSGAEGDVYDYKENHVIKDELENEIQSSLIMISFSKSANYLSEKGFPHLTKVYGFYRCINNTNRLLTDMEKVKAKSLEDLHKIIDSDTKNSIYLQTLITLFVLYRFGYSHFDLHKDNIMLVKTKYKTIKYKFEKPYPFSIEIPSYGYLVKFIDYTNVGKLTSVKGNPHEPRFLLSIGSIKGIPETRKNIPGFFRHGLSVFKTSVELNDDFTEYLEKVDNMILQRYSFYMQQPEMSVNQYNYLLSANLLKLIKEDLIDEKLKYKKFYKPVLQTKVYGFYS